MSQSTFLAGALIAGFVLFLAARNRLSTYAAVLWGATTAPVPTPTLAQQAGSAVGTGIGTVLNPVGSIGKLLGGLGNLFGASGATGATGAAAGAGDAAAGAGDASDVAAAATALI